MPGVRIKLESLLGLLTAVVGICYLLGWLNNFYYFDAFGINISSVEMGHQDYLFYSWFVVENVAFAIVFLWFSVRIRQPWILCVAVLYMFIPISAHYAFRSYDSWLASILIRNRHTLLKFIPVLAFLVVLFRHRARLAALNDLTWPHGKASLALFLVIMAAWSVSTAKHFGSFDALQAMSSPEQFLPRIADLQLATDAPERARLEASRKLYLVHCSASRYFIWNSDGFDFRATTAIPTQHVVVFIIPRDRVTMLKTAKPFEIQRGRLYW